MRPKPQVYSVGFHYQSQHRTVVVRTHQEPGGVADAVRTAILSVDPNSLSMEFGTMDDMVSGALTGPRFYMAMVGSLAAIALILAMAGLYGVISYLMSRRIREFGLRMALGARPGDLLGLVVRQGMTLVATGVALGLVGAGMLTRFLSGHLYGITPLDPITFGFVALLFASVALAANALPARRASRVDPMMALRAD